nr:hypothetical protein [Alishewanella sp. BS5-314]
MKFQKINMSIMKIGIIPNNPISARISKMKLCGYQPGSFAPINKGKELIPLPNKNVLAFSNHSSIAEVNRNTLEDESSPLSAANLWIINIFSTKSGYIKVNVKNVKIETQVIMNNRVLSNIKNENKKTTVRATKTDLAPTRLIDMHEIRKIIVTKNNLARLNDAIALIKLIENKPK